MDKQTENLTEVVTIDSEEKRTGTKINVPSSEQLVQNAAQDFIQCMQGVKNLLTNKSLGRRALVRGVMAGLALPEEGLSVKHLKSDEEKLLFAWIQKISTCKFILLQDGVNKHILENQKQSVSEETITQDTQETKDND